MTRLQNISNLLNVFQHHSNSSYLQLVQLLVDKLSSLVTKICHGHPLVFYAQSTPSHPPNYPHYELSRRAKAGAARTEPGLVRPGRTPGKWCPLRPYNDWQQNVSHGQREIQTIPGRTRIWDVTKQHHSNTRYLVGARSMMSSDQPKLVSRKL